MKTYTNYHNRRVNEIYDYAVEVFASEGLTDTLAEASILKQVIEKFSARIEDIESITLGVRSAARSEEDAQV